jgi:ribosome maturation factor RimP
MRRHPVVDRLWGELDETARSLGFELVQATFGGPGGSQALTVYVDRPGGVNAEDCAALAEQLSLLLDALDPIPGAYDLVVSSPGLDRPLGRDEDFAKYAGQRAAVRYQTAAGKARSTRGRLAGVRDGRALIETEAGVLELPLDQVVAAHLEYDWEAAGDPSAD